jgi:aminodeoxyfutalosine synthase
MTNTLFDRALDKGSRCERLSREEAGCLADSITPMRLHPAGRGGAGQSPTTLRQEGDL